MKKNKTYIAAVIAILAGLTSCQTTKFPVKEKNSATIMSVYSNKQVKWYDPFNESSKQDEGGLFSNSMNKIFTQDRAEYESANLRADNAARILEETFKSKGFELVTPKDRSELEAYNLKTKKVINPNSDKLAATGYGVIKKEDKKLIARTYEQTNTDYFIYADFYFNKEKVKISPSESKVRPFVTLTIKTFDKNGKYLGIKKFKANTKETLDFKWDNYDMDKFNELANEAIAKACKLYIDSTFDFENKVINNSEEDEVESIDDEEYIDFPIKK